MVWFIAACDVFSALLHLLVFCSWLPCFVPFVSLQGKVSHVHTSSVRLYTLFPQFDPTASCCVPRPHFSLCNHKPLWLSFFSLSFSLFCSHFLPSVLFLQSYITLCINSTSSSAGDDNQLPSASASQASVWNWPCAKINFLRCQRDLCCCIHWG